MSVTIDHIGKIIHHCGAIELLINEQLILLSKDSILANEIVKISLHKRADILKKLLERERDDLEDEFIKNLIIDIKKLGDERNIIAHNPLLSKKEDLSDTKVCFYKKGEFCEYSIDDIKRVLDLSLDVLKRAAGLQKRDS